MKVQQVKYKLAHLNPVREGDKVVSVKRTTKTPFELKNDHITIVGRNELCELSIKDDSSVSDLHCAFLVERLAGRPQAKDHADKDIVPSHVLHIQDLASTNGFNTFNDLSLKGRTHYPHMEAISGAEITVKRERLIPRMVINFGKQFYEVDVEFGSVVEEVADSIIQAGTAIADEAAKQPGELLRGSNDPNLVKLKPED